MALLRVLVAPLRRSRYRAPWITGLVTGFLLAVTGFIFIGAFLSAIAPLIIAIFIGARTANKPQFAGRAAGAAAGGMARAGIPIFIGTVLSWCAITVILVINPTPGTDSTNLWVGGIALGVIVGVIVYPVACGIAATIGAIRGRNNRPWPVLPAIYD